MAVFFPINHFLWAFVSLWQRSSAMIMSWREESDGLSVFIQDFGICRGWQAGRRAAAEPRSPASARTQPRALTHIGALNRWQPRQDYLGPLPGDGRWDCGCAPATKRSARACARAYRGW